MFFKININKTVHDVLQFVLPFPDTDFYLSEAEFVMKKT